MRLREKKPDYPSDSGKNLAYPRVKVDFKEAMQAHAVCMKKRQVA